MDVRYWKKLSIWVILLIGCGKPLPTLDGVNKAEWMSDKNGCNGLRKKMTEFVIKQKDKLLSLGETDIISLLGRPDETELYKRNEKFYKYYFSNGPGCPDTANQKAITLRFNAMGLAKEAVVE